VAGSRAEQLGQLYRGVKQARRIYYKAFVGGEVLELTKMIGPSGAPAKAFSLVAITAKWDRDKGWFYGGAKGGLMLEEGAVEDVNAFEDEWSKPGSNSYFKPGALTGGKVVPKEPTQFLSKISTRRAHQGRDRRAAEIRRIAENAPQRPDIISRGAVEDATLSAYRMLPACTAFIADKAPSEIDEVFHAGRCIGLMQGLGYASRLFGVCPPDEVTLAEKARVAVTYVEARPERMSEDFRVLAVEAMQKAWPCK
jgi:hypothetical protein